VSGVEKMGAIDRKYDVGAVISLNKAVIGQLWPFINIFRVYLLAHMTQQCYDFSYLHIIPLMYSRKTSNPPSPLQPTLPIPIFLDKSYASSKPSKHSFSTLPNTIIDPPFPTTTLS
jgi:hypothetical protein